MDITIKSTSAMLDETTCIIRTEVSIGTIATSSQEIYDTEWLMDHRMLSGSLEDRIEQMRQSAEKVTTKTVQGHFGSIAKAASEPVVEDVSAVPSSQLQGVEADILIYDQVAAKPAAKKPRAKRTTKPTESK